MDLKIKGRRALVCGASQGIGRACALALAREGVSVTALARNQEKLTQLVDELDTSSGQSHGLLIANMADTEALGALLSAHINEAEPYHILVHNAGGPPGGPAIQADVDAYLSAFRTHLLSAQTLVNALLPGFESLGSGRIVNVISTSVKVPIAGLGVSNTIRGAVASWAKTLAGELGSKGITVNNVLPGFTDTARLASLFSAKAQRLGKTPQQIEQEALATIPMGRLAEPEELAAAVVFLCSEQAAYINGINLPVDGGRTPCL